MNETTKIDITNLTQQDRTELLLELLKGIPGPIPTNENYAIFPLFSNTDIKAGTIDSIFNTVQIDFTPKRFIILEPIYEYIEKEIVYKTEERISPVKWWQKKKPIEFKEVLDRIIEHKKIKTIPRSLWEVEGIFLGNIVQWTSAGTISGDIFTPDGTWRFDGSTCRAGISIRIQLRHRSYEPIPFSGLILGEIAR